MVKSHKRAANACDRNGTGIVSSNAMEPGRNTRRGFQNKNDSLFLDWVGFKGKQWRHQMLTARSINTYIERTITHWIHFTPLFSPKIRPVENTLSTEAKACFQNRSSHFARGSWEYSVPSSESFCSRWISRRVFELIMTNDTFKEDYAYIQLKYRRKRYSSRYKPPTERIFRQEICGLELKLWFLFETNCFHSMIVVFRVRVFSRTFG